MNNEDINKLLKKMENVSILEEDDIENLIKSMSSVGIEESKMEELMEGYTARWSIYKSNREKLENLIKKAETRYRDYLQNIDFSNLVYIREAINMFLNRPDKNNLERSFNLMKRVDTLIVSVLNEL